MTEVDKLLDALTPDYEALYLENAELKKKVEVLLDRLAQYQEQEDSIKAAILNAQRMSDNIIAQAKHQANLIEREAKYNANRIAEEAERGITDKKQELEVVRREVTEFRASLIDLYRDHLATIREIPAFVEETQAELMSGENTPKLPDTGELNLAAGTLPQSAAPAAPAAPADAPQPASIPSIETSAPLEPPTEAAAQPGREVLSAVPDEQPSPDGAIDATRVFTPQKQGLEEPPAPADDTPQPYLTFERELEDIPTGGPHINFEDSLEFGSEFDIATGRKRRK